MVMWTSTKWWVGRAGESCAHCRCVAWSAPRAVCRPRAVGCSGSDAYYEVDEEAVEGGLPLNTHISHRHPPPTPAAETGSAAVSPLMTVLKAAARIFGFGGGAS